MSAEEKSLKGVALVIGQSKYSHIAPLANPANDAREMVKLLSDLGFDAVAARRAALEVLTRDNAPIDWATAQNGLGTCLLNLSNFNNEAGLLPEAKAAFEAATEIFTRDSQPLQWAFAVNNIGDVHWSLASRGGGRPDYEKAIELYESAKEGFEQAGYQPLITLTDKKIDLIKQALAKL